jgi:hypothetical protein
VTLIFARYFVSSPNVPGTTYIPVITQWIPTQIVLLLIQRMCKYLPLTVNRLRNLNTKIHEHTMHMQASILADCLSGPSMAVTSLL